MIYIAGILVVLIVLTCVALIFLVLIQLPKKDAGAGLAFGGGAADALFGAGSGNALTKVTKYATIIFFVIALLLGLVEQNLHRSNTSAFTNAVQQQQSQSPLMSPPAATPPPAAPQPVVAPPQTNGLLNVPLPATTNK